jgi:hypothetical protein
VKGGGLVATGQGSSIVVRRNARLIFEGAQPNALLVRAHMSLDPTARVQFASGAVVDSSTQITGGEVRLDGGVLPWPLTCTAQLGSSPSAPTLVLPLALLLCGAAFVLSVLTECGRVRCACRCAVRSVQVGHRQCHQQQHTTALPVLWLCRFCGLQSRVDLCSNLSHGQWRGGDCSSQHHVRGIFNVTRYAAQLDLTSGLLTITGAVGEGALVDSHITATAPLPIGPIGLTGAGVLVVPFGLVVYGCDIRSTVQIIGEVGTSAAPLPKRLLRSLSGVRSLSPSTNAVLNTCSLVCAAVQTFEPLRECKGLKHSAEEPLRRSFCTTPLLVRRLCSTCACTRGLSSAALSTTRWPPSPARSS